MANMAAKADLWFIRLPNGRVLRARNTNVLRRFLKSGRIPWESRVRHSKEEPWRPLDHANEFVDLLPKETPQPSKAPPKSVGVRGLVEELFHAFDSSLQRGKLIAAALTGLGIGIVLVLSDIGSQFLHDCTWPIYAGTAFALLLLFSVCSSILTQMTALELSRFRRVTFREASPGLLGSIGRLTIALGLVAGVILGIIAVLRILPSWLALTEATETTLQIVNAARLIAEVLCWPILILAMLLLAPVLIVEESSIVRGVLDWVGMLWKHPGRIYLYQSLAFTFAVVLMLPMVLPVLFTFAGSDNRSAVYLVTGIALTPALSYLLVAHVFIYLNLRYEFFHSTRDR